MPCFAALPFRLGVILGGGGAIGAPRPLAGVLRSPIAARIQLPLVAPVMAMWYNAARETGTMKQHDELPAVRSTGKRRRSPFVDGVRQQYGLRISRTSRGYQARVLGYPAIGGRGETREAAIGRAQAALRHALVNGHIVSVTVDAAPNPWLEDAGIWKDDPQWDEYQAAIAEYRREVDERDATLGD